MTLLAGLSTLLLPETLNAPIAQTIEEVEKKTTMEKGKVYPQFGQTNL